MSEDAVGKLFGFFFIRENLRTVPQWVIPDLPLGWNLQDGIEVKCVPSLLLCHVLHRKRPGNAIVWAEVTVLWSYINKTSFAWLVQFLFCTQLKRLVPVLEGSRWHLLGELDSCIRSCGVPLEAAWMRVVLNGACWCGSFFALQQGTQNGFQIATSAMRYLFSSISCLSCVWYIQMMVYAPWVQVIKVDK